MILDVLKNSATYTAIHPEFKNCFDFLLTKNLKALPIGRIECDGERLFFLVQEYSTKPNEHGIWEAHRRYIDIHYVVLGTERIGISPIDRMKEGPYIPEKDFQPLRGKGQMIDLQPGGFVIFFPQDAHMPGLMTNTPGIVRKIVIKCLL